MTGTRTSVVDRGELASGGWRSEFIRLLHNRTMDVVCCAAIDLGGPAGG